MVNDGNNKAKIIYESILLALSAKLSVTGSKFLTLSTTLLALCFILGWILFPGMANSGPYLNSAHGNSGVSGYGVNRTSISAFGYSKGNCAHCHEQHASIGGSEPMPNTGENSGPDIYLLFGKLWDAVGTAAIQKNVFCFLCHVEINSYQLSFQRINYSYSYWKGGGTDSCPDSIYESFQFVSNNGNSQSNCSGFFVPDNVGSSHLLQDIRALLRNKWGFSGTASRVDPCSGCHNPHKAKRDFPCSLPSAHADIYAWEVWGDSSGERMSDYTASYLAPCKYLNNPSVPLCESGSEPDSTTLPNYVGLCTDCHNSGTTINSTRLSRNLYKITWGPGGDFHGGRPRKDNGGDASGIGEYGDVLDPYKSGGLPNYVLSCTDCHEPHGSPNEFLLRKSVNGTSVGIISGNGLWYNWCQACHAINPPFTPTQHLPPVDPTLNCFSAEACHRHCDYPACADTRLF
jgi:cytochrome c553